MIIKLISKEKSTKKFSYCNITTKTIYDYIVVGGGSAGSVISGRLTENPETSLLLLEAGHSDKGLYDSWKIIMPSALTLNISNTRYNWNYFTEPQINLNNRRLHWPRGKVLGGSSSLNAMCYVRGNPLDFEIWNSVVGGWGYKDVLPYFKKAQNHELGGNDYRGNEGPLHVTRSKESNILYDAYINSGLSLDYKYTNDQNGFQQEGFGPMDSTIYKGERWNASTAYIHSVIQERKNLNISTNTTVLKIIMKGKKAVGVETEKDGKIVRFYARNEVILCSGAINSPQILMLSGIGNANDLQKIGIEPVHDLPEVGTNLHDHLEVYIQHKCKFPITLDKYANWFPSTHQKIKVGLEWFGLRSGICSTNHFAVGSFFRSRKGIKFPDIQHHFFPAAVELQSDIVQQNAYQIHCGTMRPLSRGFLKLRSNNPKEYPIIQPNLLDEKQDYEDLAMGIKLTIEILNSKAFERFNNGTLNYDVDMVFDEVKLKNWIKEKTQSSFHCTGTCAMGSVTDNEGKVYGIENLRICDASIMPYVVSGNTNASVIMMGEKIADCIKGEKLAPEEKPFYIDPQWEIKQR